MTDLIKAARVAAVGDVRSWPYYPIPIPVTKDNIGPAIIGEDAAKIVYEVWEACTMLTVSDHDNLFDAINDAFQRSFPSRYDALQARVAEAEARVADLTGMLEASSRGSEYVLSYLDRVRTEARREALEEAARICERAAYGGQYPQDDMVELGCLRSRDAIRALKE